MHNWGVARKTVPGCAICDVGPTGQFPEFPLKASRLCIGLMAVMAVAVSAPVRAQRIDTPAACGSAQQLRSRLAQLLDGGVDAASVQVRIRPEAGAYGLVVTLPSGAQRTLRDADCAALMEAAPVVIAAVLRPEVVAELPEAEPAPSADATDAVLPLGDPSSVAPRPAQPARQAASKIPAPGPAAPAQPAPSGTPEAGPQPPPSTAAARPDAHLGLGLTAGARYGVLPRLGFPLQLRLFAGRGRWGALLGGEYSAPRTESVSGAQVRVQAVSGLAALTFEPRPWLRLGLGAALHGVRGAGGNTARDQSGWLLLFGPAAQVGAWLWRRGALSLGLEGGVGWLVARPRFVVAGLGPVFRPAAVTARGALALHWDFL